MTSWDVVATTTCDIRRGCGIVNGWQQPPVVVYSGVQCLVPYPVKPALRFYLEVKPATKLIETVIRGNYEIEEADEVVIGSGIYPVVMIHEWFNRPLNLTHFMITMEEDVP